MSFLLIVVGSSALLNAMVMIRPLMPTFVTRGAVVSLSVNELENPRTGLPAVEVIDPARIV